MKPVLLDAGAMVALFDASETRHEDCVEAVASLDADLVTCEAAIAEACYLLRRVHRGPETVLRNVAAGVFAVPLRLPEMAGPVIALIKRYRNVPMDLADACLVHLAERLETGRILTLDSDFLVYRWGKNKAFESLVPSGSK